MMDRFDKSTNIVSDINAVMNSFAKQAQITTPDHFVYPSWAIPYLTEFFGDGYKIKEKEHSNRPIKMDIVYETYIDKTIAPWHKFYRKDKRKNRKW